MGASTAADKEKLIALLANRISRNKVIGQVVPLSKEDSIKVSSM
jgi:hypothetical protein